jgi:hypothetical protein
MFTATFLLHIFGNTPRHLLPLLSTSLPEYADGNHAIRGKEVVMQKLRQVEKHGEEYVSDIIVRQDMWAKEKGH